MPSHITRYSRSTFQVDNWFFKWKYPANVEPTKMSPELGVSKRCTMPKSCAAQCKAGCTDATGHDSKRKNESRLALPTSSVSTSHPAGLCTTRLYGKLATKIGPSCDDSGGLVAGEFAILMEIGD
eukprot:gnl/MRDRNA2_/MRDRNA2_23210_c0_seq1.p1 gnl/MRDRNA2_/MRDRNA2_23210_c0~~gnl/MRDRNA2_/MRDRNA2_23210_c0_seq1.p1  ORF type:complete len:125 (-),score=11.01 gnl/MRDRNA2_/MRDRNA2_23210_c0_seq1:397-771(-)